MEGISDSTDMSLNKLWEMVKDREAWHAAVHGVTALDTTELLNNNNGCIVGTQWDCVLVYSLSHKTETFYPMPETLPRLGSKTVSLI